MKDNPAISIEHVFKSFRLPHEKHTGLKQAALNFRPGKKYEMQDVLRDITFDIQKGEFFGIVGRNGSGKSTLLKLLAQIYTPEAGAITVNGTLTPFIELGVGFNPELTGRENVYLNGALLGFDRKQVNTMYQDIVDFAEIDRFMDQKLKNYSSGMQVRLAFSIAIRAKTDILLLDEVLAVGDATFQQKCFKYFKELKKQGKTVVLVSHDSSSLQEYCDRGVLLEGGRIIEQGPIDQVVKAYLRLLNDSESSNDHPEALLSSKRWGRGGVEAVKGYTTDNTDHKKSLFTDEDNDIVVKVDYRATIDVDEPVYGITITDAAGVRIFQSNTLWSEITTANLLAGETTTAEWRVPNVFNSGEFYVAPAVADRSGVTIYDWHDEFISFKIRKHLASSAHVNMRHEVKVS